MSQEQNILKLARELGDLLKQHPAVKRLQQVTVELSRNTQSQRLVSDLNRLIEKLSEKEMMGHPIEPADKRKLQDLQKQVTLDIHLRSFQQAQMDYLDLMRQVDDAMGLTAAEEASPAPGAASPSGAGLLRG